MAKQTHVRAQNDRGQSLQVSQHETDSPILPVPQLEQLHNFRPDLVDWVTAQTEKEAEHRRAREDKVNGYVFFERISGIVGGVLISMFGLGISAYVALHGQPWVAGVIGGGTLVGIVGVLVQGRGAPKRGPASKGSQEA